MDWNSYIDDEYDLSFFKDFEKMDEVFLTIDIDGKEYQCPNFVECTSFILKDESTNEIKILIGEKE